MVVRSGSGASYGSIAERIEVAFMTRKPYLLVSQEIEGLTVDQAYEIQGLLTKLREDKGEVVIGYKAGVTADQAQKRFGVKEAARGTLFESMLLRSETIDAEEFGHLIVETEIGFRFGTDITEPVKDIESLKEAVASVFPAVELPDVIYSDMEAVKGVDLIVTNIAARKLLIGREVPTKERDLNAIKVSLYLGGQEVTRGAGRNALGDQWKALRWTVNDVLVRGGKVKGGYIVITGCISDMVPGKSGQYLADYGDFGTLEFVCH
jgi:2-keto-4-pentenoate hydratase